MAKGGGSDDQTGHDLVADAKVQGCVKDIVRQRHPGGEGDDVARKQRQLHPGLTLGYPVAHRGHTTCNLRSGSDDARGGADHFGVMFIGLMG